MTTGKRAYRAIKERAKQNGTSFSEECSKIGATKDTVLYWNNRSKIGIRSDFLLEMYYQGYDVIYILTGEQHGQA